VNEGFQRAVARRAGNRCEYCRTHQSLQGATFHVEHIIPRSRAGQSILANLAWACPRCNLHKGSRVETTDPSGNQIVPLFHPRADQWTEHFHWNGYRIEGKTAIGRGTVTALNLNHPRRIRIRRVEAQFGLFPPEEG